MLHRLDFEHGLLEQFIFSGLHLILLASLFSTYFFGIAFLLLRQCQKEIIVVSVQASCKTEVLLVLQKLKSIDETELSGRPHHAIEQQHLSPCY